MTQLLAASGEGSLDSAIQRALISAGLGLLAAFAIAALILFIMHLLASAPAWFLALAISALIGAVAGGIGFITSPGGILGGTSQHQEANPRPDPNYQKQQPVQPVEPPPEVHPVPDGEPKPGQEQSEEPAGEITVVGPPDTDKYCQRPDLGFTRSMVNESGNMACLSSDNSLTDISLDPGAPAPSYDDLCATQYGSGVIYADAHSLGSNDQETIGKCIKQN